MFAIQPNEIQNINNFISEKYSPIPSIPSVPSVNTDITGGSSKTADVVNGFVVSSKNKTDSTKDDAGSNIISIDEMILNDGSDIINNYEQTLLDTDNYSYFDIFNSDEFKNVLGFTSPRNIPPSPPK